MDRKKLQDAEIIWDDGEGNVEIQETYTDGTSKIKSYKNSECWEDIYGWNDPNDTGEYYTD